MTTTVNTYNTVDALIGGPDSDVGAKDAVWGAILHAVKCIKDRNPSFRVLLGLEEDTAVLKASARPSLPLWKLFEILTVLAVLKNATHVYDISLANVAKESKPFRFEMSGHSFYISTQPRMRGGKSGFLGLPDVVITQSSSTPSPENIFAVIECKCVQRIGSQLVRAEFAKAHDLGVRSYFIWSYFTPSESLIAGAQGLGIDLCGFGFDGDTRLARLLPEPLLNFTATTLEAALHKQLFAERVLAVAKNVIGKQLTS